MLKLIDNITLEETLPKFPAINEDGTETEIICSYCKEEATRPESNGFRFDEQNDVICAKCWHLYFNMGGLEI